MMTATPLTIIHRLYTYLLRLYPASFRQTFAAEMTDIFALALADAAAQGDGSLALIAAREFAELPVNALREHARERARTRRQVDPEQAAASTTRNSLFIARWVARLAALTINLFFLSTYNFSTVLTSPLLGASFLAQVAILVSILIAWRWEKLGGKLVMLCSLLATLTIALPLTALASEAMRPGFVAISLLGALVWALPTLGFGWFFMVIGRRAQQLHTTTNERTTP